MDTKKLIKSKSPAAAVIILFNGDHHEVSAEVYERITTADKDELIRLHSDKVDAVKPSGIVEILEPQEYREKYPDKNPDRGRQVPLEYGGDKNFSIGQIAEQFLWVKEVFNYGGDMGTLVRKVWDALEKVETESQFEQFCIKNKAKTADGKITTGLGRTKTGAEIRLPFAYPFYCEIWKAIEAGRRKAAWVAEKNFKGMGVDGVMDAASKTSHIESLVRGLKKTEVEKTAAGKKIMGSARKKYTQIKAQAAVVHN